MNKKLWTVRLSSVLMAGATLVGSVALTSPVVVAAEAHSDYESQQHLVTIVDNGVQYEAYVSSRKVQDILEELKIELGEGDTTVPPLDRELGYHEALAINRASEEVVTEKIETPAEEIRRDNPQLPAGQVKVIQEGQPTIVEEETLYKVVNGERRQSVVLSSKVIQHTQPRIVEVGTMPVNMIHGKKYTKKIVMESTAYTARSGARTASGTRARVGAVAVDPRVIPLGTKLYIETADGYPSYGFAVAEDTGGAIKGNKVDLFYNTRSEALRFGRRNVVVYVLDENQ